MADGERSGNQFVPERYPGALAERRRQRVQKIGQLTVTSGGNKIMHKKCLQKHWTRRRQNLVFEQAQLLAEDETGQADWTAQCKLHRPPAEAIT